MRKHEKKMNETSIMRKKVKRTRTQKKTTMNRNNAKSQYCFEVAKNGDLSKETLKTVWY